jgi:hypothetical protein
MLPTSPTPESRPARPALPTDVPPSAAPVAAGGGAGAGAGGGAGAAPPSPFGQAHDFLDRLGALAARDWQEVMRRAYAVETGTRRAAMHRVGEILVGHPQTRAFDGLARAAHEVAQAAGRGRRVAGDLVTHAAGLAAHAAYALALRERLTAGEFDALYAPFARAVPNDGAALVPASPPR